MSGRKKYEFEDEEIDTGEYYYTEAETKELVDSFFAYSVRHEDLSKAEVAELKAQPLEAQAAIVLAGISMSWLCQAAG